MTAAELSAALVQHPKWPGWMPGMACRDPETGAVWLRMHDDQWCLSALIGMSKRAATREGKRESSQERAIAAGPLLDDPATIGCLLDWLPEYWLRRAVDYETGKPIAAWLCVKRQYHGPIRATRGDAVAAALWASWGAA